MVRVCKKPVAACGKRFAFESRGEEVERIGVREVCSCSFDWEARHLVAKAAVWYLGSEARARQRTEEGAVRIIAAGRGSRARLVWSRGGESAEMVRIASEAAVHDDKQRANAQCTAAERWLLHTALVPRLGQIPNEAKKGKGPVLQQRVVGAVG